MTEILCDRLDDYLDEDLASLDRMQFENHLEQCHECQSIVRDWHMTRQLLKSASEQLESPSHELVERIEQRSFVTVQKPAPVRRQTVVVLAALCAVIAVAISFWPLKQQMIDITQKVRSVQETMMAAADVTLSDDVIGVPIDIGDPNVTVIWVYPTEPGKGR